MDTNYKIVIQDLRRKLNNQELTLVDSVDMEKCLREFKTELYIKRDEVKQLRADLETANVEICDLKKALDSANKLCEENNFNLNIVFKKSKNMEEELLEKRDTLVKIQMQHKMTTAELKILKENLQKAETEKNDLNRKVEIFEAKQRHNTMYHNEILKRDNNLRTFIEDMNQVVTRLKSDQAEAIELSRKSQVAEELMGKLQHATKNYEKLKKEKDSFEEMYIKINAKCEKLEEYMAAGKNVNEPNLLTKIIFNQWKSNRLRYEQQLKEKNGIITKLNESYNSEKETNIKLIHQTDELKKINKVLEEKCKDSEEARSKLVEKFNLKIQDLEGKINKKPDDEIVEIKSEPIEIID